MQTFISILRGINVSGHKLVKMEKLRQLYESLGFTGVTTYVQSGNVVFQAEGETDALGKRIREMIKGELGWDVPVLVLTAPELQGIIERNPMTKQSDKDSAFFHVTFLSALPVDIDREVLDAKRSEGEELEIVGKAVYLYCPKGYGQTKLTNNFLEGKLRVEATTRNWKTVNELAGMSR